MVVMGCTNWEAGLTSSNISVSLFHCDASSLSALCSSGKQIPIKPSSLLNAGVVTGNTDILLAAPHRTTVCLSSASSSSYQNIQLTSSYMSFYKDQ